MWIITILIKGLLRKCTVQQAQEVHKYGTTNREWNSTSYCFADDQVIVAQDKDDAEYMTDN